MQKAFILFLSISCALSTLCTESPEKHTQTPSSAIITFRHDELLKESIELGRQLADPTTINPAAWAHYFAPTICMGTAISIPECYKGSNLSLWKGALIVGLTTAGVTFLTTSVLTVTVVTYKKWRIKKAIENIKQLIAQSTDQSQLLIAHELMCKYSAELLFCYPESSTTKKCITLLREIITELHRRISQLNSTETELNRFIESSMQVVESTTS